MLLLLLLLLTMLFMLLLMRLLVESQLSMMFMLQLMIILLVMDRMPVLQGFWILIACQVITEKLIMIILLLIMCDVIHYIGWLYHPQLQYNSVFINPHLHYLI